MQTAVGVLLGDRDDQAQVGLDHFFLGRARRILAFVHAFVDVLELVQRHHHAGLQIGQLLLQVLHRRDVASHDRAPGLAGGGLFLDPFQVQQLAGNLVAMLVATTEVGNKVFLRVAAFVDDDAAQFALFLADIIDLGAHHVTQFFNRFGGEPDGHQLFGQGFLRLDVARRAVTFLVIDLVNFFKQFTQPVEAAERLALEFFQFFRQRLGATLAVVIIGGVEFIKIFLGHIVIGFIGVGETVHHGGDDDLAFTDVFAQAQDFGNGGGGGRDRFHHGHQAAFDALGNFDFAFARQQLYRAHFAHVHAHRVGGAAELAVHRGKGRLGFFLGFFLGRGGRDIVVEQQRLGVRRLLINRHTHVVEHRDHDLKRFGIHQLVGQVIRNLAVRQVTACLAQLDQCLETQAALGDVFFGQHRFVEAKLFHQRALFGLADLHAQGFDLFACDYRFAHQIGFDIGHVHVVPAAGRGRILGLTAPLGPGFWCCVGIGGRGFGRSPRFLLDNNFDGRSGGGGFLQFNWRFGGRLGCGHCFDSQFGLLDNGLGRHFVQSLGRRGPGNRFGGNLGGGLCSGLDRLLGLLNRHVKPQNFKNKQSEQAPQSTDAIFVTEEKILSGKM